MATNKQKRKSVAAKAPTPEPDSSSDAAAAYNYNDADADDGEDLTKILSLVTAQFKKKNTDKSRKVESEHLQELEALRVEITKQMAAKTSSRQEKIESTKRGLDAQNEEALKTLKRIRTATDQQMESMGSVVARLEASIKETNKARTTFFEAMEAAQTAQEADMVNEIKAMKKEIHSAKQNIATVTKDNKEAVVIKQIFMAGLSV